MDIPKPFTVPSTFHKLLNKDNKSTRKSTNEPSDLQLLTPAKKLAMKIAAQVREKTLLKHLAPSERLHYILPKCADAAAHHYILIVKCPLYNICKEASQSFKSVRCTDCSTFHKNKFKIQTFLNLTTCAAKQRKISPDAIPPDIITRVPCLGEGNNYSDIVLEWVSQTMTTHVPPTKLELLHFFQKKTAANAPPLVPTQLIG